VVEKHGPAAVLLRSRLTFKFGIQLGWNGNSPVPAIVVEQASRGPSLARCGVEIFESENPDTLKEKL
jgi:hypothetical protein